ncbi:putative multidrug resistance protein [Prunus yedoensis var. nudiflora]|uniref:Putative multidrug resistance protein n=1 Tax=Prunus yedoensis var. nudiflora TaxID=2094558 RepID=A0A314YCS4_PRUYE|nr:putative multidrug resistance protein [Prunus yedoensis var. nudiflora]
MGKKGGIFRYADGVDKLLMVFGTLGSIGDGLMTPLTMLVLSRVINEYGGGEGTLTFSNAIVDKYSLRLLVVAIGVGVSAFIEGICWTRTAERQTSRMRMEYLKSVLRQEVAFFDSQANSSMTFQVISTISSDAHLIQDTIAEKVLKDLGAETNGAYRVAGGIAEQAISSIRTVYSYVGENQTLKKFSIALEKSTKLGIKQGFTKGLLIGSMGMIYAVWAFQAWVGSKLVTERGEKGGLVFISGICVILGGLAIMNALPNLSFITQATDAATRIFEMIDRIPAIDSEDERGKVLAYVKGISNLERLISAIHQDLIPQFFKDSTLKSKLLQWLRSQMGLVNQEPILFATSIKENILFGKEGASMEHVISAAKAANAHDFIVKLPLGFDTQVGQFGVQLSGGQKQRISIARAIIRDPKILLLDEATSALDAQSEKVVQEALDQASQGRTTIVIAHRLTTIRKADLIVVLQSGRVVEMGSHEDLVHKNNGEGGAYSKMLQLQQQAMQNGPDISYHPEDIIIKHPRTPHTPNSGRSSWQNSPAYPITPIFSISITNSFQAGQYDEFDDEMSQDSSYPSSSTWRLFKMNAPEWKQAILGCLGAAGFGSIQPVHAYCLGTVVAVYFETNNSTIKSETRFYCYIFLSLAVFSFIANLLQHYNFAVMGECLSKRVRIKMLEKILTFEIGWFDQDENTSAAICARLTTEANMCLHRFCDWTDSDMEDSHCNDCNTTFAHRKLLFKECSNEEYVYKSTESQAEGSQLASEAAFNHRTITAFSSQNRILNLFGDAMRGPRKENIKQSWISGFACSAPNS